MDERIATGFPLESEPEELLLAVCNIARRAADAILEVTKRLGTRATEADAKEDGSPVTQADREAHLVITEELSSLTPEIFVVSEEAYLEPEERINRALYWLVDPLDGTKEFIAGLPDFTVNIALIENGRPRLGVVALPARDRMYFALEGAGAHRVDGDEEPVPIQAFEGDRPPIAVVSRAHLNPQTEAWLWDRGIQNTVQRGSAAKMCTVAEGKADVYPRLAPTYLWDTAAGAVVAREAGCLVVRPDGQDLSYHLGAGLLHQGFVVLREQRKDLLLGARSGPCA